MMSIFVVSDERLPDAPALLDAARARGMETGGIESLETLPANTAVAFHGDVDAGIALSRSGRQLLLEPEPLFLATAEARFLKRVVEQASVAELRKIRSATFVKPAAPVDKRVFDAGVYRDGRDITLRTHETELPLLVSEPVCWLVEYRCFVLHGRVVDATTYASNGRFFRYGEGRWPTHEVESQTVRQLAEEFAAAHVADLPPAYVVDVGLTSDRGWAVIETNAAWCATLYGCDPSLVMDVLLACCCTAEKARRRCRPAKARFEG